ncbi:hypothetical protein C8J57DRAFT_1236152 [Mycena rebaudengoi]|nr:hypothetical protein C8J57DRAFT_1236152 [Mycena rebaudengoi]
MPYVSRIFCFLIYLPLVTQEAYSQSGNITVDIGVSFSVFSLSFMAHWQTYLSTRKHRKLGQHLSFEGCKRRQLRGPGRNLGPILRSHIGHSLANNNDKLFRPKAVEHNSDTVAWVVGKLENSKTVKKFDQFTMADWKYYLEQSTISIEEGKKHRREEEKEREKEKEKRRCRQKNRDCSSEEENEERKKKRKSSEAGHSGANRSSG